MRSFTASAIQFHPDSDKQANRLAIGDLVDRAAQAGAELVALPELCYWRGPQNDEPAQAEPIPGPTSEFAAALARRAGVYLAAGSMLERSDEERCFNTALLFGPGGDLLARYRKIHLFDVEIDGTVRTAESKTRRPGDGTACVSTPLGTIALAVCYDLRFPELFRQLSSQGAEIVVLPSAFTATTGAAHWHTLVRARAIENQCYFIAPDQYGPTTHGFEDYGHSLIVDPWGEVLADAGGGGPHVICAKLDGAWIDSVRRRLPSLAHRRLP
jgi:predicted amidohydrolase